MIYRITVPLPWKDLVKIGDYLENDGHKILSATHDNITSDMYYHIDISSEDAIRLALILGVKIRELADFDIGQEKQYFPATL